MTRNLVLAAVAAACLAVPVAIAFAQDDPAAPTAPDAPVPTQPAPPVDQPEDPAAPPQPDTPEGPSVDPNRPPRPDGSAAPDQPRPDARPGSAFGGARGGFTDEQIDRIAEELGLSPEQAEALRTLMRENDEARRAIMEEMQLRLRELQQQQDARLRETLDDEQYQKLQQTYRSMRRGGRGSAQPGQPGQPGQGQPGQRQPNRRGASFEEATRAALDEVGITDAEGEQLAEAWRAADEARKGMREALGSGEMTPQQVREAYQATEQELNDAMREILGEERFNQFVETRRELMTRSAEPGSSNDFRPQGPAQPRDANALADQLGLEGETRESFVAIVTDMNEQLTALREQGEANGLDPAEIARSADAIRIEAESTLRGVLSEEQFKQYRGIGRGGR